MSRPTWDGAVNAWQVRDGLWRMGRSEWVQSAGWEQVVADGVRASVDLRSDEEFGRRPTDPQDVVIPEQVRWLHRPVEDHTNAEFWDRYDPYPNHPKYYYDNVGTFPNLVGSAVATLLHAWQQHPVVVNCSAGRDRTGLVVALTLQLPEAPGGAADLDEQLRVYSAGAWGSNEHRRTSTVPHPYETYIEPEQFDRELAGRLASLEEFLADWPAEKVRELMSHGVGSGSD